MPQLRRARLDDYVDRIGEREERRVVAVSDSSLTEYLDGVAYNEWANGSSDTENFSSYIDIGGVSIEL